MYPVNPVAFETLGRTEEIIGNWCAATGRRSEVVIATKHLGEGSAAMPGGTPRITPETVPVAIEGSLKRMQTDVIDLYQLHWPNRGSYMFRKNWTYDPHSESRAAVNGEIDDILGALQREVEKGRIRAFGLSNESAWGTSQWLAGAARTGGPRVATIQNEYSLLCRLFDTDWAELSVMEDVPLLAFSPLATGLLTGKYQGGAMPYGSRMAVAKATGGTTDLGGRVTARVFDAVAAYLEIAARHGVDPAQMALAWQLTRPFTTIPIFGATTLEQLEIALGAAEVTLSDEVLDEIDAAHRAHPMPY